MYHHVKKLMYTVRVGTPDPAFGNMLLEQFGGANGELAAAMQYSIQGLNCEDPARKDLLMDIGTEELSHLEVIGTLARMHLKPMKRSRRRRGRPADRHLRRRRREPLQFAGRCLDGGLPEDHRRARRRSAQQYRRRGAGQDRLRAADRLLDDAGTKDALQFLMTREITHMKAFMRRSKAWASRRSRSARSRHAGPRRSVFQRLDRRRRAGRDRLRGPWNEGNGWKYRESPAFEELKPHTSGNGNGSKWRTRQEVSQIRGAMKWGQAPAVGLVPVLLSFKAAKSSSLNPHATAIRSNRRDCFRSETESLESPLPGAGIGRHLPCRAQCRPPRVWRRLDRFHREKPPGIDLAGHRPAARPKLHRLARLQFGDVLSCPAHAASDA